MREIKFRAWDKNNKTWWSNYATGNALVLTQDKATGIIFQQYTGLKDKNGVEIYEGDYCKSDHYQFGELEEGVVEYSHTGQYVLAQGSFKTSIHDLVFNKWKLEVIGNIYSNPELLEQSRKESNERS